MFETDAEKYADEKCGTIETEEKKFCRIDWQRGAEFGFNKANEWHYVKDKLPPSGETVLLYYGADVMGKAILSTGCIDCKGTWYKNVDDEPIKWQEITLPKESE